MNQAALGLAVAGAALGIWLLYRPDTRIRLGFYACVLGCVILRVIMGRTQGMEVNWLDVIIAASFTVGVVLEAASFLKRARKGG